MKKVKKYNEPFDNGVVEDEVVAYQRSLFESYRSRTKESQNVTYNKTDIINDDVQKVIKTKADNLSDAIIEETMISDGPNWRDLEFSHLERTVRIGTVFSGIGAIEHAFQRLKLKHKIVFAGDIDEKCKESYFANYDISEARWFSDIKDLDANIDFEIAIICLPHYLHKNITLSLLSSNKTIIKEKPLALNYNEIKE